MQWEVERHQWSTMRAQADASGIPLAICKLHGAQTKEDALEAYWSIDGVVVHQGAVFQAALAATECLIVALGTCSDIARSHILELLVQIGGGEPDLSELASGEPRIVDLCLQELVRGFSLFLGILGETTNEIEQSCCVDLLGLSCRAEPKLQERVRWYYAKVVTDPIGRKRDTLIMNWLKEMNETSSHSC